jgi:parallel beta-helix repeat protein
MSNGAYGLYPVASSDVLIDGCTVKGARDAGIYVGQSTGIVITNSEAYGNVAGIEIENSSDAEVMMNRAHDNTGGILVFNLPGLPVQDGKRANVHDNIVEDNNGPNFAAPGTTVSMLPGGIGVLVLAAGDNEIHNNDIRNNGSVGVAIVAYLEDFFGPPNDPSFDPFPQGNFVHSNTFTGNGESPDPFYASVSGGIEPIPPTMWDGCVDPDAAADAMLKNCFKDNVDGDGAAAAYIKTDLCGMPPSVDTDPAEVTCEHTPLPPQGP